MVTSCKQLAGKEADYLKSEPEVTRYKCESSKMLFCADFCPIQPTHTSNYFSQGMSYKYSAHHTAAATAADYLM